MPKAVDLTGHKYNRLTVLGFNSKKTYPKGGMQKFWDCVCDCGNKSVVATSGLRSGQTKSCGCYQSEQMKKRPSRKKKFEVGARFGRLTILAEGTIKTVPSGQQKTHWICKCDCGKIKEIYQSSLRRGLSTSCGCSHRGPVGEGAKNNSYNNYRSGARARDIVFNISKEDFHILTQKDCYYCGAPPSNGIHRKNLNGHHIYNGLDRVDNNKEYVLSNIVTSCKNCNLAKRALTQPEFLNLIKDIYEKHWK